MLNVGALIVRIGFWGMFYYGFHMEPPKMVLVILKAAVFAFAFGFSTWGLTAEGSNCGGRCSFAA